ncbi:hypothetical protein J437_LFUL001733 [Ladona fulva]|uniref:DOMON domain-containing protein n=1 Tax=Ladona fulva TaxID=123851 RepID=A0A8K0JZS4_LADFU|nr:hypothetical protein J437_LFUL001733 [Ladona fulva]
MVRSFVFSWIACLWCITSIVGVSGGRWTHSAALDNDYNYILLWTPGDDEITFEVQVKTLGYVALGFSADGRMAGADMVIGWVADGEAFLEEDLEDYFPAKFEQFLARSAAGDIAR